MFKFANPNPSKTIVGDCVVRAISLAENKTWEEVYLDLTIEGFKLKDMPSSNNVWYNYLKNIFYKVFIINYPVTVRSFARMFSGNYILATGSHVVYLSEGDWYDTWDSGDELVLYYFKKEDTNV